MVELLLLRLSNRATFMQLIQYFNILFSTLFCSRGDKKICSLSFTTEVSRSCYHVIIDFVSLLWRDGNNKLTSFDNYSLCPIHWHNKQYISRILVRLVFEHLRNVLNSGYIGWRFICKCLDLPTSSLIHDESSYLQFRSINISFTRQQ